MNVPVSADILEGPPRFVKEWFGSRVFRVSCFVTKRCNFSPGAFVPACSIDDVHEVVVDDDDDDDTNDRASLCRFVAGEDD